MKYLDNPYIIKMDVIVMHTTVFSEEEIFDVTMTEIFDRKEENNFITIRILSKEIEKTIKKIKLEE